jgi:hypothetical protein
VFAFLIVLPKMPIIASAIGSCPASAEKADSHVRHPHPARSGQRHFFLLLVFGSPGLRVGLIAGAVLWRARRIWGALIGAVIGFGLFLGGMWIYIVN